MKFAGATNLDRKSGAAQWRDLLFLSCQEIRGSAVEGSAVSGLRQVKGGNGTAKIAMDARPGGPAAKLQPSPGGLGINPEDDLSAVGAALNLGPLHLCH
jgi:hypothetical protein